MEYTEAYAQHLALFRKNRTRARLQDLIDSGNDFAAQYAETNNPQMEVLAYIPNPETDDKEAQIFINVDKDNGYYLEIANCLSEAKTEDGLKDLEEELFEWAVGEEIVTIGR